MTYRDDSLGKVTEHRHNSGDEHDPATLSIPVTKSERDRLNALRRAGRRTAEGWRLK